jgi:tryptophan synthase alpha chain
MQALAGEGRAALIVYVTYGDPDHDTTIAVVESVARAGADVVELGVPFSDPNADGVVIQEAMQRALAGGANLSKTLACASELRAAQVEIPIVLFGYYNPVFVTGVERFADRAAAAGIDAVLTVDLPVDELDELAIPLSRRGLDVVPLAAPTSTPARLARMRHLAPPFVYYISRTGVTGSAFQGSAGGETRIAEIRELIRAPVCVGFGVKTVADVERTAAIADGVVVGSVVVERIASAGREAPVAVAALVREMRAAIDRLARSG